MTTDDVESYEETPAAAEKKDAKAVAAVHDEDDDLFLDGLPPDAQKMMRQMPPQVLKQMSLMFTGTMQNPTMLAFLKKLKDGHLDKMFDSMAEDVRLGYKDTQRARWHNVLCLAVIMVFCLALIWLLSSIVPGLLPDLLEDIIKVAMGLLGGFGGGIFYERRRASR
jgi:hypothetical protein